MHTLFLVFALVFVVESYPFYRDRIPNGYNVPNPCNTRLVWDGVGHRNKAGAGVRNPFGEVRLCIVYGDV